MSLNFFGSKLINKGSTDVDPETLKGKIVALYFSASWCGPCGKFTPLLTAAYNEAKNRDLAFEVVFVSSDSDVESFDQYFDSMPWLAVPFDSVQESIRGALSDAKHAIRGIPSLYVFNSDGTLLTDKGTGLIQRKGADAIASWCA
jgi:nucleoredoxin